MRGIFKASRKKNSLIQRNSIRLSVDFSVETFRPGERKMIYLKC